MSTCAILGGSGYIGYRWACRLAERGRFDTIYLLDVRPPASPLPARMEFRLADARQPLTAALDGVKPEWLFNFAAVHREPGHSKQEYFDTNVAGAKNVCAAADLTGCQNIFFTSSIAVYGPTNGPTSETSPLYPESPYGISKLTAELIQEVWRNRDARRRLIVCRPAVIYGPGDPGNILRMIRAIKRGYFTFPGSRTVRKSYGYIEGLLDSFEFMMARPEPQLTYNYAERETETLEGLVRIAQTHLHTRTPTFAAPLPLLQVAAQCAQVLSGGRSPLHPTRVRKAAMSTHIVPERLLQTGFPFRFDFAASLKDWSTKAAGDFS